MSTCNFAGAYEALTGYQPLSWHERLYHDRFAKCDLPAVIDIPTGLAKTMVMAISLIARARHPDKIPTRLIYVVDRRTVVDQATDLAEEFAYLLAAEEKGELHEIAKRKPKLVQRKKEHADVLSELRNCLGNYGLAISTLRGQLADNRDWSCDPSRPAIIVGTVDLIGSALLFSGYRSSFKRRPLEAGLLGQDSLLVLDEAHLSRPFEKLLGAIEDVNQANPNGKSSVKPMQVIRMSATSGSSAESKTIRLEVNADGHLAGKDSEDSTIQVRFFARKRLTITQLGEKDDPNKKLADAAVELAQMPDLIGKRIVVFVRKPDDATSIAANIRRRASTKAKKGPYADSVEVLTGTMRGLERDELIEKPVLKRFLNGDEAPAANVDPVFLISTSAGEVGFDLNADHLVGDAAPLDSWIQRLGRVNRRGAGDATVILVKKSQPADKTDFDKACLAASNLLTEGMDVSPHGMAEFKASLAPDTIEQASTPKPTMVELTDILLDAWSMTSITQPMPGRPEVGPWLRGIADDLPQTTIAWRAELDEPGFADLDIDDVEEWFDTHRVLTHETLTVPTSVAATWLTDRWDKLDEIQRSEVGRRSFVIDRSGFKLVSVKEIIDQVGKKNTDSIRYADLVVPASFGGIERGVGLLDADAPTLRVENKNDDEQTGQANAKDRLATPDVADVRGRFREKVEEFEDGEAVSTPLDSKAVRPAKPARYVLELESDDDKTVRLVSYVPRREKTETGSKPQTLKKHVRAVRQKTDEIVGRLSLTDDIRRAAELAADWHDHGKVRERWQRLLVFPKGFNRPDEPMGKSGGEMKRDSRGYRHEFGSLREFSEAFQDGKLLDNAGNQLRKEVFDLAMHLIATHHGRARPHFPKGAFDPDCESRSGEIHTDAIRRFARLQRNFGWWRLAWLENLLRCADALASAEVETTEIEEAEGGET